MRRAWVGVLGTLLACGPSAAQRPDSPDRPAAPTPRSVPPLDVIPISGRLGLADVEVLLPLDTPGPSVVLERRDGGRIQVPLRPAEARDGVVVWLARVMAGDGDPAAPIRLWLRRTAQSGQAAAPDEGPFEFPAEAPPGTATPDWAKGAVWYQVFPERFRNANPANDPRSEKTFVVPWTSPWNSVSADELEAGRDRPRERHIALLGRGYDPRRSALANTRADRRYGGDLQGLVEKLDDLRDLGITAIYLNPVFEAASSHKYDASDYRHIDPAFGSDGVLATPHEAEDSATWGWTAADRYFIDVLLVEAHRRGLRVVIDGVWNHVGTGFWAFRDVIARGADSPYAPWFRARFADGSTPGWKDAALNLAPGRLIGWKSWGGDGRNGGLPEFARGDDGRLAPPVEHHVRAVTSRWMDPDGDRDPSDGVDGWRLDVVPDVPMPFWNAWSAHVKAINPDAAVLAEVWFDAKDYLGAARGGFDGQMNYPFAMPVARWVQGEPGYGADRLARALSLALSHPPQNDLVQMNLLASHDTERWASMVHNPPTTADGRGYDQGARVGIDRAYRADRPPSETYRRSLLGVAIQATWVGSPMIFYGDELGMFGGDDPDCRKPVPWPDLTAPMADPDERVEPGLRDAYRAWLRLRHDPDTAPILRYGDAALLETANPNVFAFERRLNGRAVRAVINRGSEPFDAGGLLEGDWRAVGPGANDNSVVGSEDARVWLSR